MEHSAAGHWEHFPHVADVGVRGFGESKQAAFEQAACALTAAIADIDRIDPKARVRIRCSAADDEALLVEWLNALVFEMATRGMLFRRFRVRLDGHSLEAEAYGEAVDLERHGVAAEAKGATYTELCVRQLDDGRWLAQCVVDV
ncbi:MAG TPA: archease [Gammaproteobacteria bacterium]|nr:archease [Gammaproteobacteria bacterium]